MIEDATIFFVLIDISYIKQLRKTEKKFINDFEIKIQNFLKECGGRAVNGLNNLYAFPSVFSEIAEIVVLELKKIFDFILENRDIHTGVTFILTFSENNDSSIPGHIRRLRHLTNRENSIWIEKCHIKRFERYYNIENTDEENELVPVKSHKKKKLRISDKLEQFCISPQHVETLAGKIIKETEQTKTGGKILLCKGDRFILNKLFSKIYSDYLNIEYYNVIHLPVKKDSLNPMEPFIKSLNPFLLEFAGEGENFLKSVRQNPFGRNICRDRFNEEFQYAYIDLISNFIVENRSKNKPALLVCDGTSFLDTPALNFLEFIRNKFENEAGFLMILIDDDLSQKKLPFPAEKIMTVSKKKMSVKKMSKLIEDNLKEYVENNKEIIQRTKSDQFLNDTDGSELKLYCSLVSFLEHNTAGLTGNPLELLIEQLKPLTLQVLYLVSLFDGIFNKDSFISFIDKFRTDTIGIKEHLIYLEKIGLIMKNCDETWSLTLPELSVKIEQESDEKDSFQFIAVLYEMWLEGEPIPPFILLQLLEKYGSVDKTLFVLFYLINNLLERKELSLIEELMAMSFLKERQLNASEREDLKNIFRYTTISHLFLSECDPEILTQIRKSGDFLISTKGNFSAYCTLMQGRYYCLTGDYKTGMKKTKEALFDFQRQGDHIGEVSANLDITMLFLSQQKVRTAIDYADIACRIASQLDHSYSRIKANGFMAVTAFLHGDLPSSERTIQYLLEQTENEGCYDWYLALLFLNGRILFEYGEYENSGKIFLQIRDTANKFGLKLIEETAVRWELRCRIYKGEREEARKLLKLQDTNREALFFLAESEIFELNYKKAASILQNKVCEEKLRIFQSDNFHFIDGFAPYEGRYYRNGSAYDSLYDQIQALKAYALGMNDSTEEARNIFENLCGNRVFVEGFPYIHHFHHFYQEVLNINEEGDKEFYLQILNASISELQSISGRFGNQQRKRQFVTDNFWNSKIEENSNKKRSNR